MKTSEVVQIGSDSSAEASKKQHCASSGNIFVKRFIIQQWMQLNRLSG